MSADSLNPSGGKTSKKVMESLADAQRKGLMASAKQDDVNLQAFMAQEESLLDNPSSEIFVPKYRTGKNRAQTDALAKIFNARKDDALKRKTQPGITQVRNESIL